MGYNREFEINEEQIASFLENATEKVRTTEDAEILNDLHKLFKKNVPLTVRKYVIAYMLKESLKHYRFYGNSRRNNNNERSERNNNRTNRKAGNEKKERTVSNDFTAQPASEPAAAVEERPHHPRVEIAPEDATSIFISIGKNRRVFPRDLVGILIAIAGIDRERIGDIKVLANYSFVQLYTEDAQTAIDKLNGYDYRGRKLAVSYSRQKADAEGDASEETTAPSTASAQSVSFGADQISEEEMAAEDAAAYAAAEKAAADKEPFGL